MEAIGTITSVINQVNEISGPLATAVEEQSATTNEMTRNVADAAKGSGEITSNIAGVVEAAQGASSSAQEAQKAADDLAQMAAQLRLRSINSSFSVLTLPAPNNLPVRRVQRAWLPTPEGLLGIFIACNSRSNPRISP